jgi:DNA-binding transcriptional LysR family regulator
MELRQLKQFTAVAELLSFRRAAAQLHMSQPPLTVAMKKLEEELGSKLFERRGRGIGLTAAGHAAFEIAKRCLADAEGLRVAVQTAASGESGLLRVGFIGSATYALMPKLIPAFRNRYPNIEIELRESTTKDLLTQVKAGDLDLGLVRFPTAASSPLGFQVVERDVFYAVLPAGHSLARRRKISLKALAQEPLISYAASQVPGLHAVVMLAFQQAGLSPRVSQEAIQVQTVVSLVESGLGVALVPSSSARLASKSVVFRPVEGLGASVSIGIAIAYDMQNETASAKRFRETAAQLQSRPA